MPGNRWNLRKPTAGIRGYGRKVGGSLPREHRQSWCELSTAYHEDHHHYSGIDLSTGPAGNCPEKLILGRDLGGYQEEDAPSITKDAKGHLLPPGTSITGVIPVVRAPYAKSRAVHATLIHRSVVRTLLITRGEIWVRFPRRCVDV